MSGCSSSGVQDRAAVANLALCDTYYKTSKFTGAMEDYALVAENDSYSLYMRQADLALTVVDKKTGKTMCSAVDSDEGRNNATWKAAMKSALVLTLISGNTDTKQVDLINDKNTKKIEYCDNGFRAEIFWTKYKFGMTLEVALEGNCVVANITDSSITEQDEKFRIGTISIYPFMGNSYLDQSEGYMLIPDGNGALVYLDDKEGRFSAGFSSAVYGADIGFKESSAVSLLWDKYNMVTEGEKVLAPVFGIAHTDDRMAFLGVIESGAMRASIEVLPNGVSVDYNRAYAKFTQRKLYTQPTSNNSTSGSLHLMESDRSHSDLKVRFIFLSGDEADYTGMAKAYRSYLLDNELLVKSDDGYRTRVDFLGSERENWAIGTTAVTMTTVDDVRSITEALAGNGVDRLFCLYKGWQGGGLYDLPISSYSPDGSVGSKGSLTSLMKDMWSGGSKLYLYDNALLLNPEESTADFNVINQVNKRRYRVETYKDVYDEMMYLAPERSAGNLSRLVKQLDGSDVPYLCVAGISNNIFSYNFSSQTYSRYDCAASYTDIMEEISPKTELVLEQPCAYLWKYTDAFLDMPLYTSNYVFEDESVPFLSIVLEGVIPVYADYVNFEANSREFFLKMVETGSFPSFYITKNSSADLIYTNSADIYSSEYDAFSETIAEYSRALSALYERTEGSCIERHEIRGNVSLTGYENGTTVYVNYTDTEQTVDGVTIAAMSYEVR